jgi:hypothetical protein
MGYTNKLICIYRSIALVSISFSIALIHFGAENDITSYSFMTNTASPNTQTYCINFNSEIASHYEYVPVSMKIITNKQIYNLGETILITVINNGNNSLTFPDAALGLKIKNLGTSKIHELVAAQVLTELGPGESKTMRWYQEDNEGNQVNNGTYSGEVTCGSLSKNATFIIE